MALGTSAAMIAAVLAIVAVVAHFGLSGQLGAAAPSSAGQRAAADRHADAEPRDDLEVHRMDEQPRGPRAGHCGVVSDSLQHSRCSFRRGASTCDRFVIDDFASEEEVGLILDLAVQGMRLGKKGDGGVSLIDLAHGIVSYGKQFGNLFKLAAQAAKSAKTGISKRHLDAYETVLERIRRFVVRTFVDQSAAGSLALARPAFISRITNSTAQTPNDEYWHVHVDTDQYGVFDVTTLLYLSDYQHAESEAESKAITAQLGREQFTGGTFDFVDAESDEDVDNVLALPPAKGRLLVFTSGSEHPHRVSPVRSGTRYAMTTAFSCTSDVASAEPFHVLDTLRKVLG
jgi:hypothetical protein